MESTSHRSAILSAYIVDGAAVMLIIFLATAVIIFLAQSLITLSVPYSLDYGEGPLLDQALRLSAGQPIYTPDVSQPPYTITNYPPFFMQLAALFVWLFGPTLTIGRVISLISTLAATFFLAGIVQSFTGDRLATITAAVLFLANPFVVQWASLMRVDMLALALSTGALYVLVRWPTARWSLIAAWLLLVGAVYTRQSYGLAAPLAAFVWLWFQDRRQALRLAVLVASLGLLLFITMNLATGGGFFFNIVTANVNAYSGLAYWLEVLLGTMPIVLLLSLSVFYLAWQRDPSWPLLLPYLIGSILTALTIGKIGANVNYFLELSTAVSMTAGVLLNRSSRWPWIKSALLLLLTLQVGLFLRASLAGPVAGLSYRRSDADAINELANIVDTVEGDVLVDEFMALLPQHEQSIYFQPFEMTQLANNGHWQQAGLLESIQAQEFPLILIYQYPGFGYQVHLERWTPEMLEAIEARYQPAQLLGGNILYRPLGEDQTATTAVPARNPSFDPGDLQIGAPLAIDDSPAVYLFPQIAANTNEPDHLAAGLMTTPDGDCPPLDCPLDVRFYISTDGGASWQEQPLITAGRRQLSQAVVEFGPQDVLYALSLADGQPYINHAQGEPYVMDAEPVQIGVIRNPAQPHLAALEEQLVFTYSGRIRDNVGVRLNRSADRGETWSASTGIDDGVPIDEVNAARGIAPDNAFALSGPQDDMAVVWRWDAGFWNWPLGVWFASSSDGGESFSERQKIAQTWGPINAAAHDGVYYVLYRTGLGNDQQLAVAASADGGQTWQASIASGELSLSYGFDHVSGFDIAPDGTMDIAFFAPDGDATVCALDRAAWLQQYGDRLQDDCVYNLYYTFSRDGGQTFSEPLRINEYSLQANGTPTFNTLTASVAATDPYAYVSWTSGAQNEAPQAVTVRVER